MTTSKSRPVTTFRPDSTFVPRDSDEQSDRLFEALADRVAEKLEARSLGRARSDRILRVPQIAEQLYGADTKATRRKVYHAVSQGRLPVWRDGTGIYARESVLLRHIAEQEAKAFRDGPR